MRLMSMSDLEPYTSCFPTVNTFMISRLMIQPGEYFFTFEPLCYAPAA